MNRWASRNPEAMDEIAALPPSQQNEVMRSAVGYDPDRIRDQLEEENRELREALGRAVEHAQEAARIAEWALGQLK